MEDIFGIVNKQKKDEAVQVLNSKDKSVKYSSELEVEGKLPYMDLLVSRLGNKLDFEIYRKPTNVSSYIHHDSYNPPTHKYAVFNCFINRMIRIPMSEINRQKEREKILEIGEQNGFERKKIEELMKKIEYKNRVKEVTTLQHVNDDEEEVWAPVTFHPKVHNKFKKVFKRHGLKIAPVNSWNLKGAFQNKLKDRVEPTQKSGIYEIGCQDCDKVYIGQTKRRIQTRYQEHLRCIKKGEVAKSSIAKHVQEERHQVSGEVKLIKGVKNKYLNIAENIMMYRKREKLMNEDLEGLNNILLRSLDNWQQRDHQLLEKNDISDSAD